MTTTAHRPLPELLLSLERAWYGELWGAHNRGLRLVLNGLKAVLPHRSAAGKSTAFQVAMAAGLSVRHTRRCLHRLEDLGLVEWHRGGVLYGKPEPSTFRVVKERLVELIHEARKIKPDREREHNAATAERIKQTGGFLPPQKRGKRLGRGRFRRSSHADMVSTLNPLRGGNQRGSTPAVDNQTPRVPVDEPVDGPPASKETMHRAIAQIRAGLPKPQYPKRRRPRR